MGPGGATDPSADPAVDPDADPPGPEPVDPGTPLTLPTAAPRIPLSLAVDHASSEVFRGQSIEVSGSATSAEGRAPGLRVEVLLRGSNGDERLLGVTVTDVNGNFHGSFGVPPDADVGEHALVVRSPGDAHLEAATAE